MDTLSLIFSFIAGAIVGSFLNVVSLRFNTGTGLGGRSKCLTCGNQLTWKELIPLLSFIWQKGSCRKCRSKISWQYPLVEFSAGAVFVLIFFVFPPVSLLVAVKTLIYVVSTCLLLVISVYDIKHKMIPDPFVYAFDILALVSLFVGGNSWVHQPGLWSLLAGPILALPFALIFLVSKGAWIGFGDIKLTLGIGWLLGLGGGINALILAVWIAALAGIFWMLVTYKKFKPGMELPFGPYLIIGMYLVLLFGVQVFDLNLAKEIVLSL